MRNHSAYDIGEGKAELADDNPERVFVELSRLGENLKDAKARLEEARMARESAQREETQALNLINNLHKQFVDIQRKISEQMPDGTDWEWRHHKSSFLVNKDN